MFSFRLICIAYTTVMWAGAGKHYCCWVKSARWMKPLSHVVFSSPKVTHRQKILPGFFYSICFYPKAWPWLVLFIRNIPPGLHRLLEISGWYIVGGHEFSAEKVCKWGSNVSVLCHIFRQDAHRCFSRAVPSSLLWGHGQILPDGTWPLDGSWYQLLRSTKTSANLCRRPPLHRKPWWGPGFNSDSLLSWDLNSNIMCRTIERAELFIHMFLYFLRLCFSIIIHKQFILLAMWNHSVLLLYFAKLIYVIESL